MPCPFCSGRDRFRYIDKVGEGMWLCNQCGVGDGITFVMRKTGLNFLDACKRIEEVAGMMPEIKPREPSRDDQKKALRALWGASGPVSPGDPVHKYLESRLGPLLAIPDDLRTCRKVTYWDGENETELPAMIAMVRDKDGKPVTIHRTFLTEDGEKAAIEHPRKLMPGELPAGSAIRLGEGASTLAVSEGIETALSVTKLFGFPCWAAISASGLETWIPPAEARTVVIFGDNDASFTGQAAAYSLGSRIIDRGLSAEVRIPAQIGDWNDIAMGVILSSSKTVNILI
jgi:putative DNA primase/helicase